MSNTPPADSGRSRLPCAPPSHPAVLDDQAREMLVCFRVLDATDQQRMLRLAHAMAQKSVNLTMERIQQLGATGLCALADALPPFLVEDIEVQP